MVKTFKYLILIFVLAFSDCSFKTESSFSTLCYKEINSKIQYIKTDNNGKEKGIVLENANPEKFVIINANQSGKNCVNCDIWAKDSMNVYYKHHKLSGADPATFKLLSNGYSKDKNKVYFRENLILNSNIDKFESISHFYAKDNKSIWFCGKPIKGDFETKSFEIFDGYFSKDTKNIYLNNDSNLIKIKSTNPKSFQEIENLNKSSLNSYRFYTDGNRIYFLDTEMKPGDINYFYTIPAMVSSFQPLTEKHFSMDSTNVYYRGTVLEKTIPGNHEILGNNYSKNKKSVYFKNRIIAGADNLSFELLQSDKYDAKDSINYYLNGKKVEIQQGKFIKNQQQ